MFAFTLIIFFYALVSFGASSSGPGVALFQEACISANESLSSNASAEGDVAIPDPSQICDATKNLTCVLGVCECIDRYTHDGNCSCRLGVVGFGAVCQRETNILLKRCDLEKNLICDPVILRCRCVLNYVREGDICVPGTGNYGDPCNEREHGYDILKNLDKKLLPSHRHRRIVDDPDLLERFEETMDSPDFEEWKAAQISKPRKAVPVPTTQAKTEEDVKPKCVPALYPILEQSNTTKLDEFYSQFEIGHKGCDSHKNLRCVNGTCSCTNEGNYGKFLRGKNGAKQCKLGNFYICNNNEECFSENCVKDEFAHEKIKFCMEKKYVPNTDASLSNLIQVPKRLTLFMILCNLLLDFVRIGV